MEDRHLHIICFDVPLPADYGGAIDEFYKIKTLHEAGIKLHLHCFVYNRPPHTDLENYCATVNYYKRHNDFNHFSFRLPFIVNSRKNPELIANLSQDNYPVLIEGIHCSYALFDGKLTDRKVMLRLHNAEFEYYHTLGAHEKNPLKKFYFNHESKLLKKYEAGLASKVKIAAVSERDIKLYKNNFEPADIDHLPAFTAFDTAKGVEGKGCFCLYHGNLAINENEEAAVWLLKHVFKDLDIPFVIAGKNPSERLRFLAEENAHTCLVSNPAEDELQDMIAKAQIHIIPSFNTTGIKLKLLNALYNGRHCLVNKAAVQGSGLEGICQVAEEAEEFKTAIGYLYNIPYTTAENADRQITLDRLYNNKKNLEKITDFFWGGDN
ncbi:MAG: glycosyltransferase family 4 protein [Bacteroidota bacterium]